MTQEINIEFFADVKAYGVGKKDRWLDIVTDAVGLAALGKVKNAIEENKMGNLRLSSSWHTNDQGYARDAVIELALKKYQIGAENVRLTGQEIEAAVTAGLEKNAQARRKEAENEERRKAEAQAKQEAAEKREKAIAEARELLKEELAQKDEKIAELVESRDSYRRTAQENEEEIRKKLVEDGSFDMEEEHTTTYRVVREEK